MRQGFIIAIDGPVASGKGTIAPLLAARLHGIHLYTGAMYRCVALYCLQKHIDVQDERAVLAALPEIHITFEKERIVLNGEDVTERIKQLDVARAVSSVAKIQKVRDDLILRQQAIGKKTVESGQVVVAEGRDTATYVFPTADVKIFLTAKPEIRAKRRLAQYRAQGDTTLTYEQMLEDLKKRDSTDMSYATGLTATPEKQGYTIVDNSEMTEEQLLTAIMNVAKKKGLLI